MVFHILDLSVEIRLAVWQKEYNDIYKQYSPTNNCLVSTPQPLN